MNDALSNINLRETPQSEQADERQVANNAGGYSFKVNDKAFIHRFLTLGTTGGTYYVNEDKLTKDAVKDVLFWARTRTHELVDMIVDVSLSGRAPKQNPAIFALAAAAKLGEKVEDRQYAYSKLSEVCRIGTHLFLFAQYAEQLAGWSRAQRTAVGNWYLDKPVDSVAYQVLKYRQREGWSHRDLLRLSHPKIEGHNKGQGYDALFDYIVGRRDITAVEELPQLVHDYEHAQRLTGVNQMVGLVGTSRLSWEMLPDWALNEAKVWDALIWREGGLPQTALMRQLPRLTKLGLLTPMGGTTKLVANQLASPYRLINARVHPVNVLIAQRTYASGRSARGSGEWTPSRPIVDALDEAFYAAFEAVEPTDKRLMLSLDVSGSMGAAAGGLPISCRDASAALALVTAKTEQQYMINGFTSSRASGFWGSRADTGLTELAISPRQRLDDAIKTVSGLPFGGTDCSLPMLHALEQGLQIDTFVIYTDSETWAGHMHPHQALEQYRQKTGIAARLIVVAMTGTWNTIADPSDPLSLDVSGFDSAVPTLISDFARGDV